MKENLYVWPYGAPDLSPLSEEEKIIEAQLNGKREASDNGTRERTEQSYIDTAMQSFNAVPSYVERFKHH